MNRVLAFFAVLMLCFFAYAEEEKAPADECCFTHAGYQGVCRVTPGEGETCASILEYLNSPGTVGKSYCGGSKLRGGWEAVDCEPEAETEKQSCLNPFGRK